MMEKIILELWNHGTAGNTDESCGEISIFTITGECIDFDILCKLAKRGPKELAVQTFVELPTERALKVTVDVSREESGIALIITSFEELDFF
jgi:hypothetical protein